MRILFRIERFHKNVVYTHTSVSHHMYHRLCTQFSQCFSQQLHYNLIEFHSNAHRYMVNNNKTELFHSNCWIKLSIFLKIQRSDLHYVPFRLTCYCKRTEIEKGIDGFDDGRCRMDWREVGMTHGWYSEMSSMVHSRHDYGAFANGMRWENRIYFILKLKY